MWLGFRTSNFLLQRPPFLLSSCFRCKLYTSTSSSLSHLSTCNDFLPWLQRKSGTEISSLLSIGNSIYGRSLFASKFIQAGDSILKVPFSVQLTPENVLPGIRALLSDNVGNIARLAIVLLVEQKMGQESEWAPYVNSLPLAGDLHSTIFWSEKELEMVRQSPVYKETINQKIQIEKEFLAIRQAFGHFPQFFEDITFSDFMHAYALVGSRAWGSSKGLSLIPFADFLNHDGDTEAILLGDEHMQMSEVVADRDYAPGEQVLIRYGKFPNITLMVDFGFTIPNNNYDQVQIWVSIQQDDPLLMLKIELLEKYNMPTIADVNDAEFSGLSFTIKEVRSARGKGRGIPQSLRAFLRVLSAASPQELKDLEIEAAKNDGRLARRPLENTKLEIQAHQILLLQIDHLLHEYDASIKKLRIVNGTIFDEQLAIRRKMAHDLLTGERRVLKSAYAWLTNYCFILSTQNLNHSEPRCLNTTYQ